MDRFIDVCILVVAHWHGAMALCWLYGIPGRWSRLCLEYLFSTALQTQLFFRTYLKLKFGDSRTSI